MAKLIASPGQVLCSSVPFVYVLMHKESGKLCDFCFKPKGQLFKCSACQLASFCSKTCQKNGWKYHREECKGHQHIAPFVAKDSTRLMLRLIMRLKSSDGRDASEETFGQRRTFKDLMTHKEDIKHDPVRCEEFVQLCLSLKAFVGEDFVLPDGNELFELYGKICINTFSICNKELQPIGAGLYLGPSLLDHSCRPNAVVMFDGYHLNINCIEPVYEGQKVTVSYIGQLDTTADRRESLKQSYYFQCQCDHCMDSDGDAEMRSFVCGNNCSGPVVQSYDGDFLRCKMCGRSDFDELYHQQMTDAVTKCCNIQPKLKELKSEKKFEELLHTSETCAEDLKNVLHPLNVHYVKLLEMKFDGCIEVGDFPNALSCGNQLLDSYRHHFQKYNPGLGIHLMKLGKIQLFLAQVSDALQSLQQAESIVKVTHGSSHDLYTDLQELMEQCHMELSGVQALSLTD